MTLLFSDLEHTRSAVFEEFIMACIGEKPREFSQSNFSYSGPMTANIQLGNLCARAGKKLELDENGVITNDLDWSQAALHGRSR